MQPAEDADHSVSSPAVKETVLMLLSATIPRRKGPLAKAILARYLAAQVFAAAFYHSSSPEDGAFRCGMMISRRPKILASREKAPGPSSTTAAEVSTSIR